MQALGNGKWLPGHQDGLGFYVAKAVRTGCPVPTDLWPYVLENVALINIMLLSVPQIASKSAAGTRSRLQTALVC